MLAQYLNDKKLGKIISSSFIIGHAAHPGYEKTWKMNKELCGGGVILDPGIHMIDLMNFRLGEPKSSKIFTSSLGWQTKVEDEAWLTFKYNDKSTSNHHYNLNMTKNSFAIEIIGKKGIKRLSGRGGFYVSIKFAFYVRLHWQDNKNNIKKEFSNDDKSF